MECPNYYRGESYNLSGNLGRLEERLECPLTIVDHLLDDAMHGRQYFLPIRIGQAVAAVFLGLAAVPLKGAASLINVIFREKINSVLFNREYMAWRDKIIEFDDSHKDRIIRKLIQARVLASDSRFNHILFASLNVGRNINLFHPEGRYSGFNSHLGDRTLVVCYSAGRDIQHLKTVIKNDLVARGSPTKNDSQDSKSIALENMYREQHYNTSSYPFTNGGYYERDKISPLVDQTTFHWMEYNYFFNTDKLSKHLLSLIRKPISN